MKPTSKYSLLNFDAEGLRKSGATALVGVDEAGRGAWAGPVTAAAVFIDRELYASKLFRKKIHPANDSKQLTPEAREVLFADLEQLQRAGSIRFCAGFASVLEIAEHNIVGATQLAMRRALQSVVDSEMVQDPECYELFSQSHGPMVWIDGRRLKRLGYPHRAWVKGDTLSLAIALASIVAKVTRDRHMNELDAAYPQYGFAQHKGYGTAEHQKMISLYGLSAVHRPSFDILPEEEDDLAAEDVD